MMSLYQLEEQSLPTQCVMLTSPAFCYTVIPLTPPTLSTAAPRGPFVSGVTALAPPVGPGTRSSSTPAALVTSPQPTSIGSPAPSKLDLPVPPAAAPTAEDASVTVPLIDESLADRASAASTMDLRVAASLVAFMYGLCTGVPRGHRNRAWRFKMTALQTRQIPASELPLRLGRLTHY
jgi:hypothetical protein